MDLILTNGNIITLDPARPIAEIIAIHNGKVLAVGETWRLKELKKRNTNVVDCRGKTVLPGFIDAHFHFLAFAECLVTLNLEPRNHVRSISDIQDKIRELSQTLPSGTWIRGRGYNEFYLAEKRHPTRWDLDVVTSIHPIKLTHRSGRAHVLNSLALTLVGISKETADPPEGLIDRDMETGEPTGLLYGMDDYLAKVVPPLAHDQMEKGMRLANQKCCSLGITSIHDASSRNNFKRWEMFRHWKEPRILRPRIKMILGYDGFNEYLKHPFSFPMDENQLQVGGVKIIVHETTGRLSPSQEDLTEMVLHIHRAGFQAALHAFEERTIEAACDAIEYALKHFPRPDHRHRIEHCSVCHSSLAKRIASLGIIVVTQPSFIYYNGDRYLKTIPDLQSKHLYPLATLIKEGVKVVGSSDGPIVPPNPLIGICSATCRDTEAGETLLPEERIPPIEALRLYTDDAARATFDERTKGSITPGKLADLVVLSGDPTRVPIDEIKNIEVEMTIIDGEVVWEKRG